jgi:cyclopropane fatty-acyl-phospholipid synthase-like methyltransferase
MEEDFYSVDYFGKLNAVEEVQAQVLADTVIGLYHPQSVIDLGCATGIYLKPYADKGIEVKGLELSKNALDSSVCVIPDKIEVADLRTPITLDRKYDVAVCLEVLEHIKEKYSDQAVANICNASDVLIVSMAKPGQPGEHHHTLMPRQWWFDKFQKHSFTPHYDNTAVIYDSLENSPSHTNWIDNIIVFKR